MSFEVQRVVVIVDASKDVSLSAIKWALPGLPLQPGDTLMLLGVLHQVINPSTLSKAGKLLGYKSKVDSREEVARKKEEYMNNKELEKLYQEYKNAEIDFLIDVKAGASTKVVAVKAAKSFKATWVILDRHLKKDKKYLMENLSCGIARVTSNNRIEKLKGQKASVNSKMSTSKSTGESRSSPGHVTYYEMLPSGTEDEFSPRIRLGNTEASTSSFTEDQGSPLYFRDEETTTNTEHETAGEQSPLLAADVQEEDKTNPGSGFSLEDSQIHPSNKNSDRMEDRQQDEQFKNPICSFCKNRRPKVGWKRDFTYAELQAATEGFSPKNFLSEGGFGSVYRGKLNGLKIAVKQHKSASFQGEKEFKSEVNILSTARHENLVMLLGSCSEGNQRLLVYEYVCNGSLDQHLSIHSRRILTWDKRVRIALGAAKGLQYLHEKNIIHRDMRPNNILVTHDFVSLLGDFGLAKTRHEDSEYSSETRVVGSLGYLAPEYAECGKVSTKTDVYSFGVILLQLITGRKTTDKSLEGKSLVGWARPLLKERNYPDLIDGRIGESHDVYQLFWMVRVAEKCLSKDPQKRMTMDAVVDALTYIMEGKSVGCIRDFSPAQSDSVSSMPDSTESPSDDRSFNGDKAPAHGMGYASGRLPPSRSMKPTSSGTSSSGAQSAASGETTSTTSGEIFGDTNAESSNH
ncbi:proline-rich receptor-like protein kinase PERK15 isoform X2 [Rhodamnia argentea]|uniref:Proline-rich receptor-like protein kinase PERK15 isoform X2 n=1 Tax=Rhodamnia argentea TaxID=178133 RepID=A0A8B8PJE8_9MYRT|nr:proline-rich receptor-like protein kinase PERK15 isoform X2 [Rhodamnia argentea]